MGQFLSKVFRAGGDVVGTLLAFVGLYITIYNGLSDSDKPMTVPPVAIGLFCVALLLMLGKAVANYLALSTNPELALKILTVWESDRLLKARVAAVVALKTYKEVPFDKRHPSLRAADDVLDVIEDIGAYVANNQLDKKIADHYFFHWVRGYWLLSHGYIRAWQQEEPDMWNHIESLVTALGANVVPDDERERIESDFFLDECGLTQPYPPPP